MSCSGGPTVPEALKSPTDAELGVIRHLGYGPFITRPDSVRPGEEFTVSIRTFSQNTSTPEKVDTRIVAVGSEVLIEPYNRYGPPTYLEMLQSTTHHATLTLSTPGTVRVTVRGRSWPEDEVYESTFAIEVVE